jgi:hypothetical protein
LLLQRLLLLLVELQPQQKTAHQTSLLPLLLLLLPLLAV